MPAALRAMHLDALHEQTVVGRRLDGALGTATVRDVYEALLEERHIAYTTVMTMMNILETKGYLKKGKHERAYRYRPARPERVVITAMVREFVNRVFDGASRPLLLHLVQDGR